MAPPFSMYKLWRRRAKSTSVQWRIAIRSKTDDIRNGVIVILLNWKGIATFSTSGGRATKTHSEARSNRTKAHKARFTVHVRSKDFVCCEGTFGSTSRRSIARRNQGLSPFPLSSISFTMPTQQRMRQPPEDIE